MIRCGLLLSLVPALLLAQTNFDTITVRAQALRGGVYMLTGAGGNIGLSVGTDAAFIVDDQYAPLTPKIVSAVAALTPLPIRFVLNTHWHMDHTGGNENLGTAGAVIVAHDNVRQRMSTEQFVAIMETKVPPSPPSALPVVTFADAVTFHLAGDEIHAFHVPPAHTDGDTIVHFKKANVIHMADTFFHERFPVIDLSSGGSVDGMIAASSKVVAMTESQTMCIPVHGPLSDRAGLQAFRDMLVTVRDRVRAAVAGGQ